MPTHGGLRSRVEETLGDLAPVGRRVALLLLDEHDRLGFHSAADLGRMVGTSDATVIRTVQRLGYRGMIDLKASVAAHLAPPSPSERFDASMSSTTGASAPHLQSLHETQQRALRRMDGSGVHEAVEAAAAVIARSRRVAVHAHGLSTGIAAYAAAQFARIGRDARTLGSAAGLIGDDLHQVQAGDAVVVIASGRPRSWHDALYERCADQGVRVVLLTDTQPVPLPDAVVVRVGRGDGAVVATHVGTVAAIEQILLAVASIERDQATASLDELNRHRRRLGH